MLELDLSAFVLLLCAAAGVVLGLVGGGGAILTLPILHYGAGFSPIESVVLSMAVVGSTAFVGGLAHFRSGEIDLKTGALFSVPSAVVVWFMRSYFIPLIPNSLIAIGSFDLTKDKATLIVFSLVMFLVASAMLRTPTSPRAIEKSSFKIVRSSIAVGFLTGLVGAGGGFLIVPALHLLLGRPLRVAVGTSLFIIFTNSSFGFLIEVVRGVQIPWQTLMKVVVFSISGMLLGLSAAKRISQGALKRGFAIFILVVAGLILAKEFL